MVVRLLRNTATDPPREGIYWCQAWDENTVYHKLYVGLYSDEGGNIHLLTGVTFTLATDLNETDFIQYTLTCVSTGGPATTVTWSRESDTITNETNTVLDDRVTAQYIHTLTVTERLGGLYTCSVANNKPSEASSSLLIEVASAPFNVTAVQEGLTSIRVSWSPPSPLGHTNGYRIYYSGASNGSVNVIGGETDNYILTGLQNGLKYSIIIVATSHHLPAAIDAIVNNLTLVPLVGKLSLSVTSITSTTISLFWSYPRGSVVITSEAVWHEVVSSDDFSYEAENEMGSGSSGGSSGIRIDEFGGRKGTSGSIDLTSYTIEELKSNTSYRIMIKATNRAGNTVSTPITITTANGDSESCTDDKQFGAAISGGVAAVVFIISITVVVVVIVILHKNQRQRSDYSPEIEMRIQATKNPSYEREGEEIEFRKSDCSCSSQYEDIDSSVNNSARVLRASGFYEEVQCDQQDEN